MAKYQEELETRELEKLNLQRTLDSRERDIDLLVQQHTEMQQELMTLQKTTEQHLLAEQTQEELRMQARVWTMSTCVESYLQYQP